MTQKTLPKISGLLLDLGGTVYVGSQLLPGVAKALARARDCGLRIGYVTNTSRTPRRQLCISLARLGLQITEDSLYTAPRAVHDYLKRHELHPWLLVHSDLEEEFADLPQNRPDAVVLGDAAEGFTYSRLNQAFRLLLAGAPLLSVGENRYFQEADGLSLDVGPFLRALEFASGSKALVLGKPAASFFLAATTGLGCQPGETLMIGDDVDADVIGAMQAGLRAALVRTGKFRPGDEQRLKSFSQSYVFNDIPSALSELNLIDK